MGRVRLISAAIAVPVVLALLAGCGQSHALPVQGLAQVKDLAVTGAKPLCPPTPGQPECLVLTLAGIHPACVGAACGWIPKDFQARYHLPIKYGAGTIVGIVDAGDNPNAARDLARYRSTFHLSAANFHKYTQRGQQSNYSPYTGWSVEIDLDIEMVSASCPKCTIKLVEADNPYNIDLETAEAEAVKLGATIVSNSWTCYGSDFCVSENYFNSKGVEYLASSGDAGYDRIGAPAVFTSVAAVGGTQLYVTGKRYRESVWAGAGGGCAFLIAKPPWQHDHLCRGRAVADVSAEAGCFPAVAEYDSYDGGWFPVCGTSVSSPLLAGVFALAGNVSKQYGGRTFWSASHRADLHDVCGNGCRFNTYSYGGGWGSPIGLGAF